MLDAIFKKIRPDSNIDFSSNLIEDYLLDSFDIIILIEEISAAYNIIIDQNDINMANFMTKQTILDMIQRNGGQI